MVLISNGYFNEQEEVILLEKFQKLVLIFICCNHFKERDFLNKYKDQLKNVNFIMD